MKYFFVFLFITNHLYSQSQVDSISNIKCRLIENLFKEKAFYQKALNIEFIDTITVLDMSRYFDGCDFDKVNNKIFIKKTTDLIPHPLIGNWDSDSMLRVRYKCYFMIERPEIKESLITIKFFKLLSNHSGFFTYKVEKGKLTLVDYKISQY